MTLCRKDRLVELSPWSLQSFWPCSSIVPWRTWAKICEVWKLGSGVWHWFSNELAKCWEQMQCAWKISQPFWLTVQPRRSGRILLCWDFAQHHGAWTEGEVLGRPGADVAATHDALNELLQGWYQHRPEVAHLSRHYFSSHAVLGGAAFYLEHATADDFPDLCLGWINHWITENIWRLSIKALHLYHWRSEKCSWNTSLSPHMELSVASLDRTLTAFPLSGWPRVNHALSLRITNAGVGGHSRLCWWHSGQTVRLSDWVRLCLWYSRSVQISPLYLACQVVCSSNSCLNGSQWSLNILNIFECLMEKRWPQGQESFLGLPNCSDVLGRWTPTAACRCTT